jgi:CheY-like chemotaxis protein
MAAPLRKTALVVDDDPTLLELYAEILELADYAVISCENAAQAVEVLREHVPSLLVLNPGPKGTLDVEVTRLLERDPRLASVPVLIGTTSPRRFDRIPMAPRTRTWGVISKPFDVPRLMEVVDSLARGVPFDGSGARAATSQLIAEVSEPALSELPAV